MDVSVIIVNYNTKTLTSDCIDSIIEKTQGVDYEIILVDNMSEDGSKEFFESDERLSTYIYNNTNYGFGIANNIGMKAAKGKYFFLLNSDTLLVNNAIKEFFDYAEENDDGSVYGCYLVDKNNADNLSYFDFPAFTVSEFIKKRFFRTLKKEDYSIKYVEAITGADLFVPRRTNELIGGFNPNIFLYGEESELQYRMKKKGIARIILPMPKIIHFGKQSMTFSVLKQVKMLDSSFTVLKLHMNTLTYLLARIYYAANHSLRALLCLLNGRNGAKEIFLGAFRRVELKDYDLKIL